MTTKKRTTGTKPTSAKKNNTEAGERLALVEGQARAISRSFATIRFDLEGNVLEANENFLAATGYARHEVVGRHHRMFVGEPEASSQEYKAFWQALRDGKPQTGSFRRQGKDGREIFLEASYDPILGPDGRPFCVVKVAIDVTAQRTTERELANRGERELRIRSALADTSSGMLIADEKAQILFANDTFLKMVRTYEGAIQKDLPSFRADAIVGKSMDVFHKNPAHQRRILAQLERGDYRARVSLGGRIFDLVTRAARNGDGSILGYSLEWLDVTEQVTAEREVSRVLDAAAAGDLTQRIAVDKFQGFLRGIGESINRLLDSVADSFRGVKVAVEQIGQASSQLGATSQMMSSSALQLNRAAEQSSSALVTVADGVRSNADNAAMANQLVTQTSTAAQSGQKRMEDMSSAMGAINASAQQIAKIIKVIDEIAFQTNLLALNAAVEAARAGRHGKGFAVVAQEVRSLAERSAKAAKETAALIEDSVNKVAEGVRLTDTTREALGNIVGNVIKVVDLAGEIATASGEQARSVASVTESVRQVTEGAQAGSQQSNEVAAAAEEMRRQVDVVKQSMEKYHVGQAASAFAGQANNLPPEVLEQLFALYRQKNAAAPAPNGNGNGNGNGAPKANGKGNGHDPRAVLPLDRDERGYNGF